MKRKSLVSLLLVIVMIVTAALSFTACSDGADGNTPQLRINAENYWEVSYDNGSTWTSLQVKATGADGKDGVDGKDGINGTNGTNGIDGTNGTNGTSTVKTITQTVGKAINTGDPNHILLWGGMALVSAGALIAILIVRRKKEKDEENS